MTTLQQVEIDTTQYLDTAFSIGYQLAKKSIWDGNRCNWLGSGVKAANGAWAVVQQTFGPDMYNGTAGIAYFLSLLLDQRDDPIIADTLEGTINQMLSSLDSLEEGHNYAYFGGKLGVADMLISIGKARGKTEWETKGWELLLEICQQDIQEFEIDIIAGVAGAIPVLIKRFTESKHQIIGTAIAKASDFLVEKATKTPNFWSWVSSEAIPATTGYSHGASGMAIALLEMFKLTKNTVYFNGFRMGLNFENSNYNTQLQNWYDLRDTSSGQLSCGDAWCHGAPGIALSRLKAWEITQEDAYRQEAELALNTTHRSIYNSLNNQNLPSNFSICHGLAGNADILLEGGLRLNNPTYKQVAIDVGNYGIEKYAKHGINWPSGVNDPSGGNLGMQETPGLMLGLAGTGYFYLRLATEGKLDSVLLL